MEKPKCPKCGKEMEEGTLHIEKDGVEHPLAMWYCPKEANVIFERSETMTDEQRKKIEEAAGQVACFYTSLRDRYIAGGVSEEEARQYVLTHMQHLDSIDFVTGCG